MYGGTDQQLGRVWQKDDKKIIKKIIICIVLCPGQSVSRVVGFLSNRSHYRVCSVVYIHSVY